MPDHPKRLLELAKPDAESGAEALDRGERLERRAGALVSAAVGAEETPAEREVRGGWRRLEAELFSPRPIVRRWRPALVAGLGLCMAAAAVAGWWLSRPRPAPMAPAKGERFSPGAEVPRFAESGAKVAGTPAETPPEDIVAPVAANAEGSAGDTAPPAEALRLWQSASPLQDARACHRVWQSQRSALRPVSAPVARGLLLSGSALVEAADFVLCLHADATSTGPVLFPKTGTFAPSFVKIYVVYEEVDGVRHFAQGTSSTRVLEIDSRQIVLEHEGRDNGAQDQEGPRRPTFRVRVTRGKRWVEVAPVRDVNQVGVVGKVRFGVAPGPECASDLIIDAQGGAPRGKTRMRPEARFVIGFGRRWRDEREWMWTMVGQRPPRQLTYFQVGQDPCWEDERRFAPCIESTYVDADKRAFVGVHAAPAVWHREDRSESLQAGQTYRSRFIPPFPAHFRMQARIDGAWHCRDVSDGDFALTAPVSGTLDQVLIYLYDRTPATPAEIATPMDVYRDLLCAESGGCR